MRRSALEYLRLVSGPAGASPSSPAPAPQVGQGEGKGEGEREGQWGREIQVAAVREGSLVTKTGYGLRFFGL